MRTKPLDPPPGQRQQTPSKALTKEERERRNHKIYALFIAGNSEREIGRAVDLTGQRVHQILRNELKNEGRHRQLVADEALALYSQRLDFLLKATWPKVVQQDLKAIETARRVLEQIGRLYDIEEERVGALPPANQLLDDAHDPRDELAKYRQRHARQGDSTIHAAASGEDG
jgi:hypothetical protein